MRSPWTGTRSGSSGRRSPGPGAAGTWRRSWGSPLPPRPSPPRCGKAGSRWRSPSRSPNPSSVAAWPPPLSWSQGSWPWVPSGAGTSWVVGFDRSSRWWSSPPRWPRAISRRASRSKATTRSAPWPRRSRRWSATCAASSTTSRRPRYKSPPRPARSRPTRASSTRAPRGRPRPPRRPRPRWRRWRPPSRPWPRTPRASRTTWKRPRPPSRRWARRSSRWRAPAGPWPRT